MKKIISLRLQNILLYIPFANMFILYAWIFNYSRTEKDSKVLAKSLILIFCTCIPFVIIQIVLSKILPEASSILTIINIIFIYLIPFFVGRTLIRYQKKVLKDWRQGDGSPVSFL